MSRALQVAAPIEHKQLTEVCEFYGESLFLFDSEQDFFEHIAWKEGTQAALCDYLECHNYKLSASRRINVFRKAQTEI